MKPCLYKTSLKPSCLTGQYPPRKKNNPLKCILYGMRLGFRQVNNNLIELFLLRSSICNRNRILIEILRRSREGEYCSPRDWDLKRIPQGVKKMLTKYDLQKTVNKENPVNMDMELADRFYKAGFDLAVELGMFNEARDRIIKISEDELRALLNWLLLK